MNRYNPQCIRYWVDPDKLRSGIPIEHLEKRNLCLFTPIPDQNLYRHNRYKPGALSKNKQCPVREEVNSASKTPPFSYPTLKVSPGDYAAVSAGKMIAIPEHFQWLVGKRVCIINDQTNSYRLFILCDAIGNRGYFL